MSREPVIRADLTEGAIHPGEIRHWTWVCFSDEIVAPKQGSHAIEECARMILALHNPEWAAEFAALRDVYTSSLGKLILRVEHVGSTAVPNLLAKPILDIDIVMPAYDAFPDIVAHLERLGYKHNGDQGIRDREVFKPLDNMAPYTTPPRHWMSHHLYVCPVNSIELRRHLIFRDALRTHDNLRQEYEQRKLDLADRSGGDRKVYAQMKEIECHDFVESVLAANSKTRAAYDQYQVDPRK
jgi:GrpB-like predicted nucleotidyltransferase (UPF0157 family)